MLVRKKWKKRQWLWIVVLGMRKAREYVRELDKYLEEVEAMLGSRYIGTRIYKELVEKGYNGSLAISLLGP